MSLVVGVVSLVIFGAIVAGEVQKMSALNRAPGQGTAEYLMGIVLFGFLSLLAVLLIVGAALLWRADVRGLTLHWLYAWLGLGASIVLTFAVKSDLDPRLPDVFAFLFAFLAGAIAAIYPVTIIVVLSGGLGEDETEPPPQPTEDSIREGLESLAEADPDPVETDPSAADTTTVDWIDGTSEASEDRATRRP
jgi:hypothetical protein